MRTFLTADLLITVLVFLPLFVFAQEEPSLPIADISLENVSVEQTDIRSYEVSFTLTNNTGTQPGIHSALLIVDDTSGALVDIRFSETPRTLKAGTPVSETFSYQPPETLDGDYILALQIYTQDGLSLQQQAVELITVSGSGDVETVDIDLLPQANPVIKNVILDQDAYVAGDTARISVVATIEASADLLVTLTGVDGVVCGFAETEHTPNLLRAEVSVPIEHTCTDPSVSVLLIDREGVTLGTSIYTVQSETTEDDKTVPYTRIVLVSIALLLTLVVTFRAHLRARVDPIIRLSLAFLFVGASLFMFAPLQADASQSYKSYTGKTAQGTNSCRITITPSLNKSTYSPGETINVSFSTSDSCALPQTQASFVYDVQGSSGTDSKNLTRRIISVPYMFGFLLSHSGNFAAPQRAGTYDFTFDVNGFSSQFYGFSSNRAWMTDHLSRQKSAYNSIRVKVPFTVSAPQAPDPRVSLSISTDGVSWGPATSIAVRERDADILERIRSIVAPTAHAGGAVTIDEGDTIRLSWFSQHARSCKGEGFNTGGSKNGTTPPIKPSENTTYSVTCENDIGVETKDMASVTLNPVVVLDNAAPKPTVSIRGRVKTPTKKRWHTGSFSIEGGEGIQFHYRSQNAVRCTSSDFRTFNATAGWRGTIAEPSAGSSKTYTVTCFNTDNVARSASITVTTNGAEEKDPPTPPTPPAPPASPPPSPSVTLEVRNNTQNGSWTTANITVLPDDEISLRWSSRNATTCNGSNFSTGGAEDGFTSSVTEPSAGTATTYSVSCSGSGGTDTDSLRVTAQAVNPSLSTSMPDVRMGETATISYDMEGNDPTQCSLVGPGVSYLTGSFAQQTGSVDAIINGDTTFTLTCPGGVDTLTVELIPIFFDT